MIPAHSEARLAITLEHILHHALQILPKVIHASLQTIVTICSRLGTAVGTVEQTVCLWKG